jgi:hypothetical protein
MCIMVPRAVIFVVCGLDNRTANLLAVPFLYESLDETIAEIVEIM